MPERKVISLDKRAEDEEKSFFEQLLQEGARPDCSDNVLHEMLCDESRAVVLEKEHGFSHKDYIDLTGELDILILPYTIAIHGQSQKLCGKGSSDHVPTA